MRTELFIDGRFVPAENSRRFDDIEPATEQTLASVAYGGAHDVDAAVRAARRAVDDGPWATMTLEARTKLLGAMADAIERHTRELAEIESRDVGKPFAECLTNEVPRAARNLRFFAAAAQTWTQEASLGDAKFLGEDLHLLNVTARDPLGVGAIIIPWNSPLTLATWNLGPCLATGNTCVIKPSELAPLSCIALGEIASEAGLPEGVLNVVPGMGDTGAALVNHPEVDAISFTGGVATGKQVLAAASASLRRVILELGGKSPNLVFADAHLRRTAQGVARSIFRNQGQSCIAGSRLLVERRIADQFVELVLNEVNKLVIGDPREVNTEFGPLISDSHRARVENFVAEARAAGAQVLCGGARPQHLRRGFYYLPTILDSAPSDSPAVREEIFGPVLTVQRFDDEAEAIAMANATRFGLAAYLWTESSQRALRVAQRLKTGMVWVNSFFLRDLRTPFGGARQSGLGRQGGRYSLEFWTEPKLLCIAYAEDSRRG